MPDDAAQYIEHAGESVRQALEQWNAADHHRVEKSRKLLERSVEALRTAIDLLREGDPSMNEGFQPAIENLRHDISSMIRLVDACSAFRRGMALRKGLALPAYDASGQTVSEDSPAAHGVTG